MSDDPRRAKNGRMTSMDEHLTRPATSTSELGTAGRGAEDQASPVDHTMRVELVTLFGSDLPEVKPARTMGIKLVGGTKVKAFDLATTLLAMSVAELVRRRSAVLAEREVRSRVRSRHALYVQSNGAGEGFAARVSRASREPIQVESLAIGILDGRRYTTSLDLVAMAQESLVPTGATASVGGAARIFSAKFVGRSGYSVNDESAETLRGEWQAHRDAWEAWKGVNRDLANRLWQACRKSIRLATDNGGSSNSGLV
jgi:hypothetical protein